MYRSCQRSRPVLHQLTARNPLILPAEEAEAEGGLVGVSDPEPPKVADGTTSDATFPLRFRHATDPWWLRCRLLC